MIEKNITTPDGRPVAFHDLPQSAFPFRVEAYDDDGNLVWEQTVDGPGAVEVPASPVHINEVRMICADGKVTSSIDE